MNRKVEESFKQILDSNESVERLLRPNAKRFFVMQSLISVFAMLIIAGCASLEVVEYYGFQSLWAVGILAVICIGVYMLFAGLYYKNKYYCITNKRIIIRSGMLGADYKALNIEELNTPFRAVAVDLKSTKEVCISHGNLAKAVAGSCAVPGVFVPVEFGELLLADGGLQNTIPADALRFDDCDYVISVDCNKSRTYGTDSTKVMDVISCSIRILMKSNAIKGYLYSDLVVAPETKHFKSTKMNDLDAAIEEGYKTTIDMMPQIRALFKKRKPFFNKNKKLSTKDIMFV